MFNCNICNNNKYKSFLNFGKQPIVHHLLKDKKQKYPKFDFKIVSCENCSHLQIKDSFVENLLYENYFTFSTWKNNQHIELLIQKMISLFDLNDKSKIFEVGCNDGHMLKNLKDHGFKNIEGIEPTKDAFKLAKKKTKKVYNDFFSKQFVKNNKLNGYDLVYSRHVFEHLNNPNDALAGIYEMLNDGGKILIEVPMHDMCIENLDYTFWEEHVNYFTKKTLYQLLQQNNFRVFHHETTLFSGKAIIVFAEKVKKRIKTYYDFKDEHIKIKNYIKNFAVFKKKINNFLKKCKSKPIIYGCGARTCNFVNFTGIKDMIKFFVDDNMAKQNKFVPSCSLKIEKFNKKKLNNQIILIGVNSEDENKIIKKVIKYTKLKNIYSILPPSRLLPPFWKKMIDENNLI
tara:strand:- start:813 stop:2012 length:1200 start_codon:yes stop_codon:yes gene_type:complete